MSHTTVIETALVEKVTSGYTVTTGDLSTQFKDLTSAAVQIGLLQQEIERLRADRDAWKKLVNDAEQAIGMDSVAVSPEARSLVEQCEEASQKMKRPRVGDVFTSSFQSDIDEMGLAECELLLIEEVESETDEPHKWSIRASDGMGYDCCWSSRHRVWCYNLG